jgi:hypothetical protein
VWVASRTTHVDRQHAVAALRVHHAEGRIDDAEFEERLERVYGARTRSEMARSARGLPNLGLRRFAARVLNVLLGLHAAVWLTLNVVAVTIWELTGQGTFWPAWVVVPTTALLAWHIAGSMMLSRAMRRGRSRYARRRVPV